MTDTLSAHSAGEIRAEMARQGLSQMALAERLGRTQAWVSRRLCGTTSITLDELREIASSLGKQIDQFLPVGRRSA